jgi:hypothetical protein
MKIVSVPEAGTSSSKQKMRTGTVVEAKATQARRIDLMMKAGGKEAMTRAL